MRQAGHDTDILFAGADGSGDHAAAAAAPTTSAAALLRSLRAAPPFLPGRHCSALPALHRGQVLEVCGSPGDGKTRICVSYAIEARLETAAPDATVRQVDTDHEVLLIDTEGHLPPDVIYDAALAAVEDEHVAGQIVAGIHLIRAYTRDHLPALLSTLPTVLETKRRIGLVIIDALSPPLRTHLLPTLLPPAASSRQQPHGSKKPRLSTDAADEPAAMRTHLLHQVRRMIGDLVARPVAVIATVHLASRRRTIGHASSGGGGGGGGATANEHRRASALAPALGSVWHTTQVWRITLYADDLGRHLTHWTIVPPAHQRTLLGKQTAFTVWRGGVRDDGDGATPSS